MAKQICFGVVLMMCSGLAFATADLNELSECVWDKYYTQAEELRIKVNKTKNQKAAGELKKLRDKKNAFEILKKEKFFDEDEGLKTTFPDEHAACLLEN